MQRECEYQRETQDAHTSHDEIQHTAVVIVGAGPTGLATANLLGMAGVQTLLIERNTGLSDCPRAIAIDDEGLRICQAMGLRDEVMRHLILDIDAQYISGHTLLATVSPTGRRNGYPLASTFHQPTFEAVLLNGIERFPCVSVLFQHTLESFQQDDEGVTLLVRTPDARIMHVRCSYLLACDGGQSATRHALHIPMHAPSVLPPWLLHRGGRETKRSKNTMAALEQRWISIDCASRTDTDDPMRRDVGYFFCHYQRPAVTLPTPFHGRRWEFMVLPDEQPEQMLDDETLYALIKQALAYAPPELSMKQEQRPHIIRRTYYTFHTAIADSFRQGRIFLLGDAAHLMPPFAGQGMNSGLRDAHNLYWKLQLVLNNEASPRLLESYHMERAPHAEQTTLYTSLPGRAVTTLSRPLAFLRDHILPLHSRIPVLRDAVTELRIKPASRYAHGLSLSSLLSRHNCYGKFDGLLLPQPLITTLNGQTLLLDDMLGNDFTLLAYCETAQEHEKLQALTSEGIWKHLAVRAIGLQTLRTKTQNHLQVADNRSVFIAGEVGGTKDTSLFALLKSRPGMCALVRPDRFILGLFNIQDARKVAHVLHHWLQNEETQ